MCLSTFLTASFLQFATSVYSLKQRTFADREDPAPASQVHTLNDWLHVSGCSYYLNLKLEQLCWATLDPWVLASLRLIPTDTAHLQAIH